MLQIILIVLVVGAYYAVLDSRIFVSTISVVLMKYFILPAAYFGFGYSSYVNIFKCIICKRQL